MFDVEVSLYIFNFGKLLDGSPTVAKVFYCTLYIWAFTLYRQGLLVTENFTLPLRTSCVVRWRTIDSSRKYTKLHIWHHGMLHSGALRLAKPDGKIAWPEAITNGQLLAAGSCKQVWNSRACLDFTSAELLVSLDTRLAVCEYTSWKSRLNNERTIVFHCSRNS